MTQAIVPLAENISWERMIRAVEKVRERLLRAAAALERAGVPYAVVGGNAVASWVSTIDEGAVRNTQDVDVLVRRSDLDAVKAALTAVGFVHHEVLGGDLFIDGPTAKPSQGVHLLYAGEYVKEGELAPCPDVSESQPGGGGYRVVKLDALVRMKLTSFRRKDQVHLEDLIRLGLIDSTWPARYPPELGARLQLILDTPGG